MNVTDICAIMTASSDSYSQFVKLSATYREANGVTCEDASWTDMIEYLSSIDKDATNSARPWVYQTCNEFGYYQTTDSEVIVIVSNYQIDYVIFINNSHMLCRINHLLHGQS